MEPPTNPGDSPTRTPSSPLPLNYTARGRSGYTLVMLLFAVFLLTIGMLVAMPVWETQIRRDMEEELIFRGGQYVEAIRVFQSQNPGRYPESLDQLFEDNCLRRPFKDPMAETGDWNVILLPDDLPGAGSRGRARGSRRQRIRRSGQQQQPDPGRSGGSQSPQKILIAPQQALESIPNARVIGVVSSSTRDSIRIFHDQTTYDRWLFFIGFNPEKFPEIEFYGEDRKDDQS